MLRSCKKTPLIMSTLQALTWSPCLNSYPFHSPHSSWRDLSKSDHVSESWCWLLSATVAGFKLLSTLFPAPKP